MAHTARAHWISSLVMMAIAASCITWIILSKEEAKPGVSIINGTSVADMFRVPTSPAHCLFRVIKSSAEDTHLAWEKWVSGKNVSLDRNRTWITVEEQGVYLFYVHLTYSLRKDGNSSSVDLMLSASFNYTEHTEEFLGAFDTRQVTEKEQDAQLSAFFLLRMKAGNRLAVTAWPKTRIKYGDTRPFSSYITIVRFADW